MINAPDSPHAKTIAHFFSFPSSQAHSSSPMALAPSPPSILLPRCEAKLSEPNSEAIKQRLIRKGVVPTPKILHTLRKKELQKSLRRARKKALNSETLTLSAAQKKILEEEAQFRAARVEYRAFKEEVEKRKERTMLMSGKPWEGSMVTDLRGIGSLCEDLGEGRLKEEHLVELREMLEKRSGKGFRWLLEDDVEEVEVDEKVKEWKPFSPESLAREDEKIKWLVERLNKMDLDIKDWKFPRLMKQSGLYFSEVHLLKIVDRLGVLGSWKHVSSVVQWVYNEKGYRYLKSRAVYTKLLSVLGKARRPNEALHIFNAMREDGQIYPDMAAYHAIAVTLGQAGFLKELIDIIDCMRQKPSKKIKNMRRRDWDPCLEPDIIIFNAVLNACIPSHQWKGVFWVLEQIRKRSLEPNGATYGLAMEVMLKSRKYDLVHRFFEKMQRSGLATKALTYKVLVKAFWEEGKADEAVKAVRDMEQRGVVGTASLYYELACCLCNKGRWLDAVTEVDRLKRLPLTKPLEVTFTGMILCSLDGGHTNDCISMFEYMKHHCTPNIGTMNAMLKVYGRSDMFAKAKELFESIEDPDLKYCGHVKSLKPDGYTYSSMLEVSASAHQWDYFEHVYKKMALVGYELDPKKYAWLLVEASRAGKWHVLEHAFDEVLEAGEIPHLLLFTEMVCQTIAHQNFQRTVALINGMAHASMQIKEDQWVAIFQRNIDRVTKDELLNLFNYLNGSDIVMEDPVPALLKALQTICESQPVKKTLENSVTIHGSTNKLLSHRKSEDARGSKKIQGYLSGCTLADTIGKLEHCGEYTGSSVGHTDNMKQGPSVNVHLEESEDEVASCTCDDNNSKNIDPVSCESADSSLLDATDAAIDLLSRHIDGPWSDLPTASQILKAWREDRIKDGGYSSQKGS